MAKCRFPGCCVNLYNKNKSGLCKSHRFEPMPDRGPKIAERADVRRIEVPVCGVSLGDGRFDKVSLAREPWL